MTWFRALTLSVTASMVIVVGISLDAQTVPPASQSNAIAVSAALQKTELPVGQPAWVILSIDSYILLAAHAVGVSSGSLWMDKLASPGRTAARY
jgi:hypothetical protein